MTFEAAGATYSGKWESKIGRVIKERHLERRAKYLGEGSKADSW